jgi:hypothetical protein
MGSDNWFEIDRRLAAWRRVNPDGLPTMPLLKCEYATLL